MGLVVFPYASPLLLEFGFFQLPLLVLHLLRNCMGTARQGFTFDGGITIATSPVMAVFWCLEWRRAPRRYSAVWR